MHRYIFALQNTRPTNATYGYDFRETSAASHAVVVQKVRKADFEDKLAFQPVRRCWSLQRTAHVKPAEGQSDSILKRYYAGELTQPQD